MPAVRAWLVWWALLTAFYVVLVDTRRIQELVAAVVVGALGATASLIVRRERDESCAAVAHRAARAARDPRVAARSVAAQGALVRRPRGRVVEVPFEGNASDAALAVAERSLAPNTVVIDVDEERGVLIYHELVERSPLTAGGQGAFARGDPVGLTVWMACAAALVALLVALLCALAAVAALGNPSDGLVALQMASMVATIALLVMSVALDREIFGDLALVLGVSSFVGGLAYATLLEREP